MQNRHVDDLIDAYALGALEPDEVEAVERHLEGCESCRSLVEDARRRADLLLYAVPSTPPPPSLRARLMERIAAEKRSGSTGRVGGAGDAGGVGGGASETLHAADVSPNAASPAGSTATTHAASPAAEPAAPAPPGYFGRVLRALRGRAPFEEHAAGDLLRDLLADPECVVWPVAGTEAAPEASARFVTSRNRRDAVFVASGLQPPGAGKAYQVWLLRGGQPLPNTLFEVGRAGVGAGIVHADAAWGDFDTVAVTPEPAGGSPAPTGSIVLAGALT